MNFSKTSNAFKGSLISDAIFGFGPIVIKCAKSRTSTFSRQPNLGYKVEDFDFAHFFEGGTKVKILSEIKPPLKVNVQNTKAPLTFFRLIWIVQRNLWFSITNYVVH